MTDYKQLSIFDDEEMYIEDQSEDNLVEEYDNYALYQTEGKNEGTYEYVVYDAYGISVAKWTSRVDCLSMSTSDYKRSANRQVFMKVISQEKDKARKEAQQKAAKEKAASIPAKPKYNYADDDDDVSWYRSTNSTSSYRSPSYSGSYGGYSYTPKIKSTGFLDKLNKSDTLVIHCADRSTDMLSQIYNGKGWDVLRDGDIDKSELHQLLQSHDRIVCLGHGTSGGLINVQGGGTVIGAAEAPYLKDKKLFIIWCNADGYFNAHNIGKGQFITGNMPSEVWECRAAGCGEISSELMLENITYWSKLCADVVDRALAGDAQGAVDYVRDKYIEKYGDHPVTIYNAERTKVHGKPMEDLSDRYWGPEELLHPAKPAYPSYSSYNRSTTGSAATKPTTDIESPDEDDEEVNYDYTDEELQEFAEEVSNIYQINPEVQDFDGDVQIMQNYIEEVEDRITELYDLGEIVYWTDVQDGSKVGIKIVLEDMEEYYYSIDDNGDLKPW